MEAKSQLTLVDRALAHIEARTTDADAARGPTALAATTYLGDEGLAREQERLFLGLPIAVAHASSLRSPGDFLTHDELGVPLLLVRPVALSTVLGQNRLHVPHKIGRQTERGGA